MAEAAVGQAAPNATYVGQRLLYDRTPEQPFDPISNPRFLAQMRQKALLLTFVWFAGGILAWIFFGVLIWLIGRPGLTIGVWCTVLTWLVLGCFFWLLPLPALLSEWKFSVTGQGAAGARAFEHIAWVLARRQTPLDVLQVRRLNLPGEGKRDYLELKRGIFTGYVACFPFGQDLYVGWTFWVGITPLRWLLMVLARLLRAVNHRNTDLYSRLRFDSAMAMREAMHSSVREGIEVAIGQLAGQGQGIIGTMIGIQETARIPD